MVRVHRQECALGEAEGLDSKERARKEKDCARTLFETGRAYRSRHAWSWMRNNSCLPIVVGVTIDSGPHPGLPFAFQPPSDPTA